jgi:hypothetical protein
MELIEKGNGMRANHFTTGTLKSLVIIPAMTVIFAIFAPTATTGGGAQDLTFRLMNIERRLDQLQIRVDTIERTLQNQAMSRASSPNVSTEMLLELQRQQLSLAEQIVTMQKRMLEMQKTIDRLSARETEQEKEKPKEEAKPKPQPKKP